MLTVNDHNCWIKDFSVLMAVKQQLHDGLGFKFGAGP